MASYNRRSSLVVFWFSLMLFAAPLSQARAELVLFLSTDNTEELDGLVFKDGDTASYNLTTSQASLFLDEESIFAGNEDIESLHILENGNIVLSMESTSRIGGLTIKGGDLVEYDPVTGSAAKIFDSKLFGKKHGNKKQSIDAVHVRSNGNIILSTTTKAFLGGLSFRDGDLVEYDPATDTAMLFFSEDLFAKNADIDAFDILDNGNLILSTKGKASLGGLSFEDGDLVEYNQLTGIASLLFSENSFGNGGEIDAVSSLGSNLQVPEPATILLFGMGSLVFFVRKTR